VPIEPCGWDKNLFAAQATPNPATATAQSTAMTFNIVRRESRTRTKDFPEEDPTEKCGFVWVLCMIRRRQSPPGSGFLYVAA
jgi:hypothetical protein